VRSRLSVPSYKSTSTRKTLNGSACKKCGAGHYRATAVLQIEEAPWGLRLQTDEDVQEEVRRWPRLQDAPFYRQGFDCLIYRCDNCLNRYGDRVEKQTAYVPVPNPCVTYCNLFMFQIKKLGYLTFWIPLVELPYSFLFGIHLQIYHLISTLNFIGTLRTTTFVLFFIFIVIIFSLISIYQLLLLLPPPQINLATVEISRLGTP
jgi:hypothetical protein